MEVSCTNVRLGALACKVAWRSLMVRSLSSHQQASVRGPVKNLAGGCEVRNQLAHTAILLKFTLSRPQHAFKVGRACVVGEGLSPIQRRRSGAQSGHRAPRAE